MAEKGHLDEDAAFFCRDGTSPRVPFEVEASIERLDCSEDNHSVAETKQGSSNGRPDRSLAAEMRSEISRTYSKHCGQLQMMLEAHVARVESMIRSLQLSSFQYSVSPAMSDGHFQPPAPPSVDYADLMQIVNGNGADPKGLMPPSTMEGNSRPSVGCGDLMTTKTTTGNSSDAGGFPDRLPIPNTISEELQSVKPSTDTFRPEQSNFLGFDRTRRKSAIQEGKRHSTVGALIEYDDTSESSLWRLPADQSEETAVQKIVASKTFETFTALAILSNAAFIGIQVDWMASNRTEKTPPVIVAVQCLYCVIFLGEVVVRLAADWRAFLYGPEMRWNLADIVIVGASILEVILEATPQASIVRLVRMMRLLRILRIIRTIRLYRSLRILVYSIFSTMKQLGWTLILILLIMYMFSIVFTQATTEHLLENDIGSVVDESEDDKLNVEKVYGTVPKSLYTLFKTICGGVDWGDVADPLSDIGWGFVALFQIYVAFMFFAVLNVVVGVFCNSAIESAQKDEAAIVNERIAAKEAYSGQLRKLFQDVDSARNGGMITLVDLEHKLGEEGMRAWLIALEIEVSDAWTLFKLLDTHEHNVITVDAFVEGCLQLKGNARSIDIATMMYENRWIMNKLVRMSGDLHDVQYEISKMSQFLSPHSLLQRSSPHARSEAVTGSKSS